MSILRIPVGPNDHAQGNADAPITLLEYGDYQCPHCARAYPIVKAVQSHFGDAIRFVFRNFPLREVHPWAETAAEAAEFAATERKFWPMHDLLFENQSRLGQDLFFAIGSQLGLDSDALQQALAEGRFTDKIRHELSGGVRSGVNGTPTFFINGSRHDADFEFDTLVDAIGEAAKVAPPRA
jgi:protein-disulfide isomerase